MQMIVQSTRAPAQMRDRNFLMNIHATIGNNGDKLGRRARDKTTGTGV